jgi:hypothetical protein
MTVMKRILKIVLVIIVFLVLTISISNFLSIENQASIWDPENGWGDNGTTVVLPDGRIGCQGAPLDC